VSRAAIQCARVVVAQVNAAMPRTAGEGQVHVSHFDRVVYKDVPLPEAPRDELDDASRRIGELIATKLVKDGATLQMGIGTIPDAVLAALGGHRDLGVHTEMLSDGVIDLVESGVINNRCKSVNPGLTVTSFLTGSKRLYDWVHANAGLAMRDVGYTNDAAVIATQHRMTALNSCIEIDLTGQVVADSIGTRIYSGVGGQVDFLRGAGLADDGVPILALPSTTSKGESRIAAYCKQGGGVVTTRAHVHYVVTEFGIAMLFGKSLRERARALIAIAHPKHRDALEKAACERLNVKCL
jgi:acyl-CoA hydrolase